MENKYGYRNVWYDARKKCMHLWGWDSKGNRTETIESFHPYLYLETTQETGILSIFETNLKKITFPSQFERRKYAKDCGIKRLFYNHRAEQQYLLDRFLNQNENIEFVVNPLKVCFLDIEVYAHDEFPTPEEAKHSINLLTMYDSIESKYHTFGIGEYTPKDKKKNRVYYNCHNEIDLLKKFLIFWESDYPDVVSGWNSDGFDIPYIINRINNILGEEQSKRLSPVGSLYYKESIKQKFGKTVGRWIIHGINNVDYMEVYQTFSKEKRESYSLQYISSVEIGDSKDRINATSLAALSDENWNAYVDYNIQDVALLVKLEKKLRFLQTMRIISHKGFCTLESTLGKVIVVGGAISAQALKRNRILSTFEHDDMGDYKGGFVKEIESGLKEDVITFDADSLYPNVIITLNLSPETKIGKVVASDKLKNEVTVLLVNGKMHTLTRENFLSFIEKEKISISKARVLYSQKKKGIVPEYVDSLYSERVTNSDEKTKLETQLLTLEKNSDEYDTVKRKMDHYDIMQYTLKILLNSIYGVFANRFGPLYDIDAASSITVTGQSCIKAASDLLDEFAKNVYDISKSITHYNDTDSCHCTLTSIFKQLKIKLMENDSITPEAYKLANEFNDMLNTGIEAWAKNSLNSLDPRFHFKREAICSAALYQSKKHYILHIRDKGKKDPMPCNKIKPVGVEIVKSTMSASIKAMIMTVVVELLNSRDREKTLSAYRKIFKEFNDLTVEEISFRSGLASYNNYAPQCVRFSKPKRTPVAVAAAIYHNNLLEKLDITSKYEKLQSSYRTRWAYCKPTNKYNIDKIAFLDKYPEEFDFIKIDYKKMFKKIVEPSITRLFKCAHWKMVDLDAEYSIDLLDFFKM